MSGLDQCPPVINLVKTQPDVERQYINAALRALARCIGHSNLPDPTGHAGEYLSTDGTNIFWATVSGGSGTVTSVNASGGTTGLSFSGGPITTSGTLTLAGVLALTNGGTGATTANDALNNLLPDQTGQAGRVLLTNGTNTRWEDAPGGSVSIPISLEMIDASPGSELLFSVEQAMTLSSYTLLADMDGDLELDIWVSPYANFDRPADPSAADSICGGNYPTLVGMDKWRDTTLVGWTVAIPANSTCILKVNSISGISNFNFTLNGVYAASTGGVASVSGGDGTVVDNADPFNPIVEARLSTDVGNNISFGTDGGLFSAGGGGGSGAPYITGIAPNSTVGDPYTWTATANNTGGGLIFWEVTEGTNPALDEPFNNTMLDQTGTVSGTTDYPAGNIEFEIAFTVKTGPLAGATAYSRQRIVVDATSTWIDSFSYDPPSFTNVVVLDVSPSRQIGDLMVAYVYLNWPGYDITTPSGWTLKGGAGGNPTGDFTNLRVYERIVDGTEPSNYTWTSTGGADWMCGSLHTYRGVTSVSLIGTIFTANSNPMNIPLTASSISPAATGVLHAVFGAGDSPFAVITPSGMTQRAATAKSNYSHWVYELNPAVSGPTGNKQLSRAPNAELSSRLAAYLVHLT